ncbi:MAG: peroxidase family protein [Alphaproteobacteria bacterium]
MSLLGEYRAITGVGNNIDNPEYGSTHVQFLRKSLADYADGLSTPSGDDRPSARVISNVIFDQQESVPNTSNSSNFLWLWGQFLDHDIDLTGEASVPEMFNISVPTGDPHFDPFFTGTNEIPLTRSGFDPGTGVSSPAEQVNDITSYIDASNVYGSDATREAFLRDTGGKLRLDEDGYMPFNDGTIPNAMGMGTNFFVAGDVRANENVALTSMHTIFAREHNRKVDELKAEHPEYTDEQLYQEAKAFVEALMQKITYDEFLPELLGEDAIAEYTGYDANVNPGIDNEFATAAYRLGHTMLSSTIERVDEQGNTIAEGDLGLFEAFFNPAKLTDEGGPDPIFRGMAASNAEEIDNLMVDDVRNMLFGPPGAGGMDLASLNIQRGRDHGIDDYNAVRVAYGLDPVADFTDVTSDVDLQNDLSTLYDGDVNNVDLFVGGLSEESVEGSQVGETFHTILVDQFERLRDGDRFYYENRLDEEDIKEIQNTTLSDIIQRNTDIEHLQSNVFEAYNRMVGDEGKDRIKGTDENDLIAGEGGDDRLHGKDGNDYIKGGDGKDKLFGNDGDDELLGGAGKDTLRGHDGNDILEGGGGKDYLYGGDGLDKLFGDAGNDMLKGQGGDDHIEGGLGNDKLYGNAGDDVLKGDEGNDRLYGGSGNDKFLFELTEGEFGYLANMGNDRIKDYQNGDEIVFMGDGVTDVLDVAADVTLSTQGNNLIISFDGGGQIKVDGMGGTLNLLDLNVTVEV